MKNFITLTAMALCLSVTVQAQWVKTNFPTSMPNDMYITSDGRIIVGEYSKMYSDEGAGGIYMSDDNGDTWQIADIANYNYTVFLEADGYFYAFGEDAKIARTKDFEDWEIMDYKFLYDTEELLLDCYAAVYYNGRIYCAPFGSTPAYTENFGEKWILTDPTGLDPFQSGVYLYGFVEFKEKLYAYGGDGIFRLNEDGYTWELLEQTFYATSAMVVDDRLYISFDVQGTPNTFMYTDDGENWYTMTLPEEYADFNSIGCMFSIQDVFFISSLKGIFYSNDNMTSWVDISEGWPMENPAYSNPYIKMTTMLYKDKYLYAAGFDYITDQGGVFKLDIGGLLSIDNKQNKEQNIIINDNIIAVYDKNKAALIEIYDISGKKIKEAYQQINIIDLNYGAYIYRVTYSDSKTFTGKFIR